MRADWRPLALTMEPINGVNLEIIVNTLRATSYTRLRARDHYTSSTLIGGKGGAGPSLLHTTLEGPTEYVNARWM